MEEYELYQKLKEVSELLDKYQKGEIKRGLLSWDKEILKESQEILRKSHVAGAIGAPCSCCNGSGRN